MRTIKIFLRTIFVLLILFFIAASIYVRIYGKSLLESALNTSLKRNVVLGSVSYHFPLGFRAQDVSIARSREGGEFLKIKTVLTRLAVDALYQKKFIFDSVVLIGPSVLVEGKKDPEVAVQGPAPRQGTIVVPAEKGPSASVDQTAPAEVAGAQAQVRIIIRHLIVKQGLLQYKEGLTEKGFSFDLEDVHLKAEQLVFPLEPARSGFKMTARLIKKGTPLSGSHVQAAGWVDVMRRDMDASVEVVEKDGTVGLTAKAVSKSNDMDVTGEIKMHNLLKGVDKQAASGESTVNDLILNALSSSGVEIGAKFAFKTRMDDFRVGQVSFSGNVVTK